MELQILEEKDNELFKRKEIKATAEAEITPSRAEILKVLAEKFSVPAENIKIKGIHGKFGSKTFSIEANIYASLEEKDALEIKKKKEGVQAEEKPVEEPVSEVAKEEEPVNEEKPEVVDDKPQESKIEDNKTPSESEVKQEEPKEEIKSEEGTQNE